MAVYVVGDIQGCYQEFLALFAKINFDFSRDELWLAGDLINRGPESLAVLRFVKNFPGKLSCVLGNHDLHLLAAASGVRQIKPSDTFTDILNAPDREELLAWLRQQPLMVYRPELKTIMVHAGVYPFWTLTQALQYAAEFSQLLNSDHYLEFFQHMYGDVPRHWQDDLSVWPRFRFIVNAFTRMRVLDADDGLNLSFDQTLNDLPPGCFPWFGKLLPEYQSMKIVFGHWAALLGVTNQANVFALDTGCVWGNQLTAMRLQDGQLFQVEARKKK